MPIAKTRLILSLLIFYLKDKNHFMCEANIMKYFFSAAEEIFIKKNSHKIHTNIISCVVETLVQIKFPGWSPGVDHCLAYDIVSLDQSRFSKSGHFITKRVIDDWMKLTSEQSHILRGKL